MIEVTVQEYRIREEGLTERTFEVDGNYFSIQMEEATEAVLLIMNRENQVVASFKHWVRVSVQGKLLELPNAVGDGGNASSVHVYK